MNITIGNHDSSTHTVSVTFDHSGVSHSRPVNACYTAEGEYDAEATRDRVEQVARGVENKITLGVIVASDPISAEPSE